MVRGLPNCIVCMFHPEQWVQEKEAFTAGLLFRNEVCVEMRVGY